MCAVLILHSVVCNWWRKEGGVRWDTRRSGSFIPTRTNTHSRPSPDTESGSLQGLLNRFTPTTPTKKDLWGQTNQQSNIFLCRNLYLSHNMTIVALKFLGGATIANALFFFNAAVFGDSTHNMPTKKELLGLCTSLLFHHLVVSNSLTPWTAACQASLSFTISRSLLKLMSIEPVMPFNHLILCRPFSSWPQSFPAGGSFQWVDFSNQVAKVLVSVTVASIYTPTNSA